MDEFDNFCYGEPIWDTNLFWNTSIPRFTRCFTRTIPIWFPSLFLLIFAPLEAYFILHSRATNDGKTRSIPYNRYNITRFIAVIMIVLVNVIQFAIDFRHYLIPDVSHYLSIADLTFTLLNCFTFVLFGFVIGLHRIYGLHTSGLAFFFTFFSVILSLPTIYMYVMFFGDDSILVDPYRTGLQHWSLTEMYLFAIHFGLLLVLFLLTCFADFLPPFSTNKQCKPIQDAFAINGNAVSLSTPEELVEMKDVVSNGNDEHSQQRTPLMENQTPTSKEPEECPQLTASFLSQLTFWWFNPLAITGFKKSLTLDDLWRLNPNDATSCIAPKFDQSWLSQIKTPKTNDVNENSEESMPNVSFVKPSSNKKPSTIYTITQTFGLYFVNGAFFKFGHDCLQFVNPFLLKIFIGFISEKNDPNWHGFVIAFLFFVTSMTQSFMLNYYFTVMYTIGMRIRSALVSAIYRKSLNLSNDARRQTTTGEIVNLMSVDANRFVDLLPYVNLVWSAPLQIILTVYFLYHELGASTFAGLAIMVLMIPLNAFLSTFQRRLQIRQMKKKDERVKVVSEAMNGIRVIKLYGWEIPFMTRISAVRDNEIRQLEINSYISAVTSFLWTCTPFMVSFVTFAIYILSSDENVLDAKKAFVSLALFNLLRFPLTMLPMLITQVVMASVSVKRLNKFLHSTQLEKYVTRNDEDGTENSITIEGGQFGWETIDNQTKQTEKISVSDTNKDEDVSKKLLESNEINGQNSNESSSGSSSSKSFTLNDINIQIKKGSLVAIVGNVGSGKSSLLAAILGDMERHSGTINIARSESIAYVAQQAWMRNVSLRDNILFGSTYIKSRYDRVLEMCALKPDIAILPGGDQTEIGEKGINLSGGQKQRIAIARACYAQSSLVLLDDPLSAVDSHVSRHIFTKVIANDTGFLKDRTRVLVTNNISLLPNVDQIIVLSNGSITEMGTYEQLMENGKQFSKFVQEHSNEQKGNDEREDSPLKESRSDSFTNSSRQRSATVENKKKLIEVEKAETGNVQFSVYLKYFRSLTYPWLSLMLFGYIAMQAASVGSNVWLAIWSNDVNRVTNQSIGNETDNVVSNSTSTEPLQDFALRNHRLMIYGLLGFAQAFFIVVGSFAMARGSVNSSRTLHRSLLYRIMRSPMSFFDTTPLGRILNRFSKDIDTVDTTIPHTIRGWIFCLLQAISTFLLISYEIPVFILVAIPILGLYYFIQKFYVATSRQLKRLESVTRSPIYSHFGETLAGVHTIRAYGAARRFINDSNHIVDTNQRCYYPNFISNRWLALYLDFCGNFIILSAATFAVTYRDILQPGIVGLLLTYALSVTQMLNWFVRMTSEMESNVVSVERISEYCELVSEKEWVRPVNSEPTIPEFWPSNGEVKFDDYSVRYRVGLDMVLNSISINIQSGEKIGIVGRTGAGKSSLTLALFRILEAAQGRIIIDGIDIGKIGLHELRLKLSIIPQDPVLFSGTIRSNLDPFGKYSDDLLWQALEHSHLKDYIASQDAGLDYVVNENGENFSVGQRQLICLGRALLRRTKILVLDEATAAIDLKTDALIQQTIRSEFSNCTVLTIAHRLKTIMDSSRVLVLDKGKIAEFDSPENLLADRRSKFYALAKDSRLV